MKKLFHFLAFSVIALSCYSQTRGFIEVRKVAKDHVALIIGNSNYPDMPLANPVNDANDVAKTFEEMGFIVDKVLDADKEQMAMAIDRFSKKMSTTKVAVFYYAGHGMQVDGQNYLIPVAHSTSGEITDESQVSYRAINASEVLSAMENNKVKFAMVVLDACRNNPIKGSGRGKLKGLASIDAPVGSLVMYSTKAGDVATDGTGRNSPFTTAFLQNIVTPGLDVNLLPSRLTKTVSELTNGIQTPGSYIQLTESFTFVPEISSEEIANMKDNELGNLKGQLTILQIKESEINKQKAEEEAIMQKKQTEIDALEKQILELRNKTEQSANSETYNYNNNLDEMLAIVRKRAERQAELDALRTKAEEERKRREAELAEIKRNMVLKEQEERDRIYIQKVSKIESDLKKYREIANSGFGDDLKEDAWNNILSSWGLGKGNVKIGDESDLMTKIWHIEYSYMFDERDNKKYRTVKIGSQVWMAENLAYKPRGGNYWRYDVKIYGYLYNWETAQNVCPDGWHLPSYAEWSTLINYLGGASVAGGKMKETGTALWDNPNLGATNSSGFSALPSGQCDWEGRIMRIKYDCYYWSSTASYDRRAYGLNLLYFTSEAKFENGLNSKGWGYSVRCIQD